MKRVSIAKTPSSVWGLISPPELVTMKVRPWLIVMPGGATLISIGIILSLGDCEDRPSMLCCLDESQDGPGWIAIASLDRYLPVAVASVNLRIARADTLGKHKVLLCPEGTSLHERHDREVLQLLLQCRSLLTRPFVTL